jgi:hypothetical protein
MFRAARLMPDPEATRVERIREAIAFSPAIPAALAGLLTFLVGGLLSDEAAGADRGVIAALAAAGSWVVYGIDRLRDLDRDRETSPRRAAFVERHRPALSLSLLAAGLLGGLCLLSAPLSTGLLCGGIGGVGLLHRRLKQIAALKTLYVSVAWTAVCVGLPWSAFGGRRALPLVLQLSAILLPCFWANLIASNLRDAETSWLRDRPRPVIAIAAAIATLGLMVALAGAAPGRVLAWVPAALLLALAGYRPSELYGHLVVDGALLGGSGLVAIHLSLL